MLELGSDSKHYHEELYPLIVEASPNKLILCGDEMKHLWRRFDIEKVMLMLMPIRTLMLMPTLMPMVMVIQAQR